MSDPRPSPRGVTSQDLGRSDVRLPETIGPFRVQGLLGKGGMGVVLDAVAPDGGQVALKLIRPQGDLERTQLVVKRFLRESQILRQLDHPCIVRLVDAGDLDGLLFLAMDRIEGVSLLAIRREGPMELDALVAIGGQLCDALAHMHDLGVIHRDIKPANILVDHGGRPVITDFGISSVEGASGITRHGDLLGSPGFMPPEVTQGQPQSPAADQFALGRVLFELAARGPPPRIQLNVPIMQLLMQSLKIDWTRFPEEAEWDGLRAVLERMLAQSPEQRYPNAHEAREAFRALTMGALGDFDTISEHVGKLDLPPDNPWADGETVVRPPSRAGPALTAPSQPARLPDDDPVLAELDRPAGEATELDSSLAALGLDREAMKAKLEAAKARARSAVSVFDDDDDVPARLTEPPEPMAPDAFSTSDEMEGYAPTHPELEPPLGMPAASAATQPVAPVNQGGLSASIIDAEEDTIAPTFVPRQGDQRPPSLRLDMNPQAPMPMAGKPLSEIVASFAGDEAPTDAPRGAPGDRAAAAETAHLRDQVRRLKEQLIEASKSRAPAAPAGHVVPLKFGLAISCGALLFGLVLGLLVAPEPSGPPSIVYLPMPATKAGPPLVVGEGGELSPEKLEDARRYLNSGYQYLAERDIDSATRYLKIRIEDSNLPECHRLLGTVLALTGDPAAEAHFRRYLELQPNAPDAAQIREALP